MTLILETAPDSFPVSIPEAKQHLRVDCNSEDTAIAGMIAAATQRLDGSRGLLGRALITQTWMLRIDSFPISIKLPLPRLISVDAIRYLDVAGDQQTLDVSNYAVNGTGSDDPAILLPAKGYSWPSTWDFPGAVEVEFTAGYGAQADIPGPIKAAILLDIGNLYANRESLSYGTPVTVPDGWHERVAPYRLYGFGG